MKNIYKSLLALSLVFSLGLSAAEDNTGAPIIASQLSKADITFGSVIANAAAVGAISLANIVVLRQLLTMPNSNAAFCVLLAVIPANIAAARVSSDLIKKMGLKSDPLLLHALSTSWLALALSAHFSGWTKIVAEMSKIKPSAGIAGINPSNFLHE